MSDRLEDALLAFDRANADDPHRESVRGVAEPKELVYARRMSARLDRFAPEASTVVRLAVRAQHIRRWTIPRDRFPPGREGYRLWRGSLSAFHAETAGTILRQTGYDEVTVERVGALLRKERLKADPEAQLVEDVACLVFLEHYLDDFARKHDEDKVLDIVRKTWRKMSSRGQAAAHGLALTPRVAELLARALGR